MENNPGGLREGEGGKAGALLLPAAQVNIIIVVITIITSLSSSCPYKYMQFNYKPLQSKPIPIL